MGDGFIIYSKSMAEPDFVLLYLGSLFEALHDAPERDDPMLDALAGQILDELPKTLLGLIIKACAARWLRRNLWMVEFDSLAPSDQAARIVIDSAMRIAGSELDSQRHHRTKTWNGAPSMSLIADTAAFQRKLADLPIATYQAGETVLTAASTTGRLLILKKGAVAVLKEGVEISKVAEPGAVFGELSVLLDQPHTADVVAVKASQFYSLMGPHCSCKTRSHSFTFRQSWRGVSTAPMRRSSS